MTETRHRSPITKALRGLTIAVWCLCALTLAQILLYVAAYMRPLGFSTEAASTSIGRAAQATPGPIPGEPMRRSSFDEPSPEEMVKEASAILLTQWRRVKGEPREIVTEILKHRRGTTLHYSVGDEYELPGVGFRHEYASSDGNVIFMEGSPAWMRCAYSYRGERVAAFGDMPLRKLRELARSAK